MPKRLLLDIIREEMNLLKSKGWVYFAKPYPCSYDEMSGYYNWQMVDPDDIVITRDDKEITIRLIPSDKRRKLAIIQRMWVA